MHTRSPTIYTGYHGNVGKEESNYVFKYKKGRVREPSAGKKKRQTALSYRGWTFIRDKRTVHEKLYQVNSVYLI